MELILALACEDARKRPDGRIDLIGVFDELSAPGFPARQDRMTVIFVMQWSAGQEGRQEFTADLVAPAGDKVLTIEGHTDVAAAAAPTPPRTELIMPLENVIFPHAGEYRFQLTAAGETRPAFALVVSQGPPDG